MKNKLIAGITTLITTAMLSGCSLPLTPLEMIKPPKMEMKQEEMKQAAEQFIPKGAKFTVPKQSEQAGSFVQVDLNNDGTGELAVFYKDQTGIGMLLLEQDGSKWQLREQITGYGSSLDYAGFHDVDRDKKPEILFGGEGYGEDNKLIIYKLDGEKYKEFSRLDYAGFSVGDLEGDGLMEIASIVRVNKQIPSVKLQVHSFNDKSLQQEFETEFEGGFPDQVTIGAARKDQQGIFVDIGVGAHSAFTELLVKENGEFKKVLANSAGDYFHQTFKPYPLACKDINDDGIIEIGIQAAPPETDHLPMVAVPWISRWYQWDGDSSLTPEPVMEEYSDYGEGYRFVIPQNWHGKYTINRETGENSEVDSVHFIYLAEDKKKAELLVLHYIPKADWQQQEQKFKNNKQSYVLLGENNTNMLVAELPQNNAGLAGDSLKEYEEMLLDKESIKKNFVKLY